ncbi:hypothetical protein RUND412_004550 [Rhizina undulata]
MRFQFILFTLIPIAKSFPLWSFTYPVPELAIPSHFLFGPAIKNCDSPHPVVVSFVEIVFTPAPFPSFNPILRLKFNGSTTGPLFFNDIASTLRLEVIPLNEPGLPQPPAEEFGLNISVPLCPDVGCHIPADSPFRLTHTELLPPQINVMEEYSTALGILVFVPNGEERVEDAPECLVGTAVFLKPHNSWTRGEKDLKRKRGEKEDDVGMWRGAMECAISGVMGIWGNGPVNC